MVGFVGTVWQEESAVGCVVFGEDSGSCGVSVVVEVARVGSVKLGIVQD